MASTHSAAQEQVELRVTTDIKMYFTALEYNLYLESLTQMNGQIDGEGKRLPFEMK